MTASQPAQPDTRSQASVGFFMFALIPMAQRRLRRLQERTSLSGTDIANRAITWYEFADAQQRAGHDLLVRNNRTGEIQLVQIR